MNKKIIPMFAIITILFMIPVVAFASDREDIEDLRNAKISLVEAIQIAEKDRGGQAYEASLDDDSFQPAYEVEIVKDDNTIWDVYVNSQTGQVISAREDKDD